MRPYMLLAIFAFCVAASAGLALRFGLAYGMPPWIENYSAWRHAHSHLMYFGWGTLGLMALIWHFVPQYTGRALPRGVHWQMSLTALAALLSFPAFLPNGYGTTQIGNAALPLGSMVSGWNGLLWIVFAVLYVRATHGLAVRPLPIRLWDWAILLLMLACAGAMGLVVLIVLEHSSVALRQIMLHLFLELVAAGWFTMALLGVLWAWLATRVATPAELPAAWLGVCLAPTFFLGVAPVLVPPSIFWISVAANLGAAVALAVHLRAFWRVRGELPLLARFGFLFLAVQIVIAGVLLWPGLWYWAAATQLRVFMLHALLLGWMSSPLWGLAQTIWFPVAGGWARLGQAAWMGGVGTLVAALLALGPVGRMPLPPVDLLLQIAAWSTVPIVAGAVLHWLGGWLGGGRRECLPIPSQSAPATPRGHFQDSPK